MIRRSKGISSVIASIIIMPLIIGVLVYSVYTLRTEYIEYSNMLSGQSYNALSKTEALEGFITKNNTGIKMILENYGLSESVVKLLFIHIEFEKGDKLSFIVNLSSNKSSSLNPIHSIIIKGNQTPKVGLIIQPSHKAIIEISFTDIISSATAGALTEYGNYIKFKPEEKRGPASSIVTNLVMFTVPSLTDLQTRSDVSIVDAEKVVAPGSPSDPGEGMTLASGVSGLWCLYSVLENVNITGSEYYSVLAVGFSGGWTLTREGAPTYSILVTTTYNYYSNIKIKSDNSSIDIGRLLSYLRKHPSTGKAVKLIVYGYRGDIGLYDGNTGAYYENFENPANVVGIRLYGQYADNSWVKLNGTADKVYVYVRKYNCGGSKNVSYTPYIILGDFDNNGNSELLFMTEDGFFQEGQYPGDDVDLWGEYADLDLDDYSSRPITFYFKGYPIDSSRYSALQIAIRYYFHDNAPGDEDEIDTNNWIMRIGFYDYENRSLTSYYELRYQYLTKMEDTYPPSWDYRIDTIQLLVPPTGKTYYIGLQFRDPYGVPGTVNRLGYYEDDADIMLGVEYLSMILLEKP